ncbi:MAG: hypothetical protein HY898_34440 [Deltaproteobacteria bacterium]|nr:hypothetical protein [Deltaproteobacteria bacterium]
MKLFDRHWLLLDRDGSVLLVASSTKLRKHAIFRFTAVGSGVRLVRIAAGYLPSAPVVDLAGYGFIVRKNDNSPPTLIRMRELGHGAAVSSAAMGAYL